MAQQNKTSFLSRIGSNSGLSSLRKKLKGNEENCPVRTLSQLMDPSIAVPKTNASLRSLRSKPASSQSKASDTLHVNKVVVSARIETPPLSNSNQRNRNENISYGSGRNAASVEPSQGRSMENAAHENLSAVNDHAFAVPEMRAPKTDKTLNQYLAEIDTAATLCSNLLDEDLFQKWCMVLYAYCLNKVSEADENHVRTDEEIEIGKLLDAFVENVAENGTFEVKLNPRPNDEDNFSSISGHPPYIPAGFNQFGSDQTSVVNGNFGYGSRSNVSVLGFNCTGLPGSTASYRKGPSSLLGFGGANNLNSSNKDSKLPAWFVPKFMNPEINSSMMGGMRHPYSDIYQNQAFHQSMMGHGMSSMMGGHGASSMMGGLGASSMIGYPNQSTMGGHGMGHLNQSIISHYPQSVIGYPNQTMIGGNGMPLHSMAAMNQFRRGMNNTMMNMGGLSSRYMPENMTMMQPTVCLERLNPRETVNNQDDSGSEFQAESDRMPAPPPKMQAPPPRMLPPQPKYFNFTMAEPSRNPLRSINENIPVRSEPRIIATDNNSKRVNTCIPPTKRARPANTPARATRNKIPPNTPATGNVMNTSKVTRSGRTVKTPQHYWASDVSAVPVMAVEQRGTKRKRYSNA